jgi:hypothetical protein
MTSIADGARVTQWVRSLDLKAHTSLSPIRQGFAPIFVNYKKGALQMVFWFLYHYLPYYLKQSPISVWLFFQHFFFMVLKMIPTSVKGLTCISLINNWWIIRIPFDTQIDYWFWRQLSRKRNCAQLIHIAKLSQINTTYRQYNSV